MTYFSKVFGLSGAPSSSSGILSFLRNSVLANHANFGPFYVFPDGEKYKGSKKAVAVGRKGVRRGLKKVYRKTWMKKRVGVDRPKIIRLPKGEEGGRGRSYNMYDGDGDGDGDGGEVEEQEKRRRKREPEATTTTTTSSRSWRRRRRRSKMD